MVPGGLQQRQPGVGDVGGVAVVGKRKSDDGEVMIFGFLDEFIVELE